MTITPGHTRQTQSNGGASMSSRVFPERTRGNHGSIGSGFNYGNSMLSRHAEGSTARPTREELSGSSSLLDSSVYDGVYGRPSVPWRTTTQSNVLTPSSTEDRSTEWSGTALNDPNDSMGYFAQTTSSNRGASPGMSRKYQLGSEPERFSPTSGFFRNGDRRNMGFTDSPGTYQTRSGITSPLDANRSEQMSQLNMSSMPRTMGDPLPQQNTRNGYTRTSHNSTSFITQRPAHTTFPSFNSDTPFNSRYSDYSTGIEAKFGRMQMNENSGTASRPPYVTRGSLDTSLNQMLTSSSNSEAIYTDKKAYDNEALSQYPGTAYQPSPSPHLADRGPLSQAGYMNEAYYPNGINPRQFPKNGIASNTFGNQFNLQQGLQGAHAAEPSYQVPADMLAYQRQYVPGSEYDYGGPNAMVKASYVAQLRAASLAANQVARDNTISESMSPTMKEFRATMKTRTWQLKDIWGYVVEFAGDQHGSRFLQEKIALANSDDKGQVFREIEEDCMALSQDIFGNYVIQKMFEHGNLIQKTRIADKMRNKVWVLSQSPFACRVVQKAFDHVLNDQQQSLIHELEPVVLECVHHQNGNHVVQKAFESGTAQNTKVLVKHFRNQIEKQSTHTFGCRVIQRMLEHCDDTDRQWILAELHLCTAKLIEDQYGNYVVQHVIKNGAKTDSEAMVDVVRRRLLHYSKHKFASNVVEKCITKGSEHQRRDIMASLTGQSVPDSQLIDLMQDQYGNYVFQQIVACLEGAQRAALVERIKPLLIHLKRPNCGKQIAAIDKLIGESNPPSNPAIRSDHASTTPPNSHKSSPQPLKSSVDGRFMATPPTPPPTEAQTNGDKVAPLPETGRSTLNPTTGI